MADNPISYSDFIQPDGSISELIKQLQQLKDAYSESLSQIKASSESLSQLRSNAQSLEGEIKALNTTTRDGQNSMKEAAAKTEQLAKAHEELKKKEAKQRSEAEKLKKAMDEEKKAVKKLKEETGQYESKTAKLEKLLANLNKRLKEIENSQGKNSRAYKLVRTEIERTKMSLNNLTGAQQKSITAWDRFKTRIQMITGAYLAVSAAQKSFRFTIDTFVGFEKTMSAVKAISGATGKELKLLKEDAQRLGATTTKTAIEVGTLQKVLAKTGYSVKEILASTEAIILLSEAAEEDLAPAAELASGVVRGFGKDAEFTAHAADVMAASFTKSKLDADKFRSSISYVAPDARAAGISFEYTSSMLSVLADNMISGTRAGRSLRRIITEIEKSGRPTTDRLKELAERGIDLADANDEVGQHAQTALLVLSKNMDKVEEMSTLYERTSGDVKKMADTMRDNVAGAAKLSVSAWAGLILKLTEGNTTLRRVVDFTADIAKWLTKNYKAVKLLIQVLTLALIAWSSYRIAIWLSNTALAKHVKTIYADVVAKGLMTTATKAATSAMRTFTDAIKKNQIGMLVSLVLTVVSALAMFINVTGKAADEQERLNEELDDTNNLLGKKIYEEFLKGIGRIKTELITLPDGTKKLISVFDESVDVVDKLGERVRKLKESDLYALSSYFNSVILETKRGLEDIEPGSLLQEAELQNLAEYESYLAAIEAEIERIKKLRELGPVVKTVDEKEAKKIRDLELSVMKEGLAKELKEQENSYLDKKAKFKKYGLDMQALDVWNQEQIAKINKEYLEKETAVRLKSMSEGKEKEFAELEIKYRENNELFEKFGLDQVSLEEWHQKELQKIRDKYAKKEKDAADKKKKALYNAQKDVYDQEFDFENSRIDILKATEAEKTKLRLEAEKDKLQKIIELNENGEGLLSDIQIATMANSIKKIDQELASSKTKDFDLYSLMGIKLDDEKKEAISTSTEFAVGQVQELLQAKAEAAARAIEIANREVDTAQNRLNMELEARNKGYASNVSLAEKELNMAKKNQEKALKEQKKAQKAQLALQTITQASDLVSASAKIWSQLGFPWAIPALAVMWGSFAAAKIKAAQLTKKEYAEGGLEFLDYGDSHSSGNDIHLGLTSDGKDRRAERGEALAIVKKSATRKYKNNLPDIIDSINKGIFEQKYGNFYGTDSMRVNIIQNNTNLHTLEKDVNDIKKQGERRYFMDNKGRIIETYKNLKRVYNVR